MEWLQPLIEKQAFLYLLGRWNIFTQDSHQTLGLSIEKGLINRERGWWLLWMGPCLSLNWTGVCVCVWWIIGPCLLPVKLFPVLVPSNGVDWCLRVVTEKAHDWNASPEATVLVSVFLWFTLILWRYFDGWPAVEDSMLPLDPVLRHSHPSHHQSTQGSLFIQSCSNNSEKQRLGFHPLVVWCFCCLDKFYVLSYLWRDEPAERREALLGAAYPSISGQLQIGYFCNTWVKLYF